MMFKNLCWVAMFATVISVSVFSQTYTCSSPNGKLRLQFSVDDQGKPTYSLNYKEKVVLEPSQLGVAIKDMADFGQAFRIQQVDSSSVNETWNPIWGEVKQIRNNYKTLILTLVDNAPKAHELQLIFRVFDDGIGFRYAFPTQDHLHYFVLSDEKTSFNFTGDHKIWWIPGDFDTNEYAYNTTKISGVSEKSKKKDGSIFTATPIDGAFVQTPLMMKTDAGLYINVHEAALVNYPCMDLNFNTTTYEAKAELAPGVLGSKAYLRTPFQTPWRTIIVSDDARDILASKTILNLNEPSKLSKVDFIKPMKYVGIWLEMHWGLSSWDYSGTQIASDAGGSKTVAKPHGATTANTKKYIDFAAKNGFGGVLVEGWNTGWEDWFGNWKEDVFDFITPYPDYDVKWLNTYANEKGVSIITHHETSGSATNYEWWMDTAYRQMKALGSHALKSGYVGRIIPRGEFHDGQWMVNHYLRAIQKAANYDIMVVAHEPVRPTGLHRTYPNFMAAEAARGQEFNFWSEGNPPEHETILPFTRIMGGPMDYTPGIFKIKKSSYVPGAKEQVHTTLAKQLALYITLYSPIQMATDLPENYEAKPDAFQFIKDVPVDWDDTKILHAEPGEYITIARKEKNAANWYVGSITDEQARDMNIAFDFLDKGAKYELTMYQDAKDASWDNKPEAYEIKKQFITSKSTLTYHLARGGGIAMSIKKL